MKELSKPEKLRVLREARETIAKRTDYMCLVVKHILSPNKFLHNYQIREFIPEFKRPSYAVSQYSCAWFEEDDKASRLRYLDELIEKIENEELLEEARRRYPEGTRFIDPTATGNMYTATCSAWLHRDDVICVCPKGEGGVVYFEGKWAEIVHSHKVKVYLYMHPDGKYYTSTSELLEEELLDLIPIGSKEVEFFETIKS